MKLTFNLAFDGAAWPGPLGTGREAVAGEAWVGSQGLLDSLETQLGLGGLWPTVAARDAAVIAAARHQEGFWSASFAVDPFGVARALRRWRDELMLQGWSGATRARAGRVAALARVTQGLPPGVPDRLRSLVSEIAPGRLELEELVLLAQPEDSLPKLWQEVLRALRAAGVRVTSAELSRPRRRAGLDLARCLGKGFDPLRDGSLQLVRPAGPLQAAEVLAAWLALQPDLAGTVIIAGDGLLDTALRQQGLPTLGGHSSGGGDPLLAVLPLVLDLAWQPSDPQKAMDLLGLPLSPVPRRLAASLAGELSGWPAIGSEGWDQSMKDGIARYEDEKRRRSIADRLARLFRAEVTGDRYPTREALERALLVERWARGFLAAEEPEDDQPTTPRDWLAVVTQCSAFRSVLEASPVEALSRAQLHDLVDQAGEGLRSSRLPAQAGLAAVASPAQLAGAAHTVIWWSFTEAAAERPRFPLYSEAEMAALASAGVVIPSVPESTRIATEAWRRPFILAGERLVLVCPWVDEAGEPAFPHPVWDEVRARLSRAQEARLMEPTPLGLTTSRKLMPLALPVPAPVWHVSAGLPGPETLSPSSIATFLGCPLAFVLQKHVRLEGSGVPRLQLDGRLCGSLAHEVMERLFAPGQALPAPEEARDRALALLDELLPRRVALLYLPGQQNARSELRRRIGEAASGLATALTAAKARVAAVEQNLTQPWKGRTLRGVADLVLSKPLGEPLEVRPVIGHRLPARRVRAPARIGRGAGP
jgi:hypothetical protein